MDTAASNLQLTLTEQEVEEGLELRCTASIGEVYWHATRESSQVNNRWLLLQFL